MDNLTEFTITGVSALAAAVTAWFTIVLSRLTKAMAVEAKRANDREQTADVGLSILLNPHNVNIVELTAKNIGAASARNITISVPAAFVRPRGESRERVDLLVEIATLLPGAEVRIFLDVYQSLPKGTPIVAKAEFSDGRGRQETTLEQDMRGLAPMIQIRAPSEEAILKVGRAAEALDLAMRGVNALRVDVRTAQDRERERQHWETDANATGVPVTPNPEN